MSGCLIYHLDLSLLCHNNLGSTLCRRLNEAPRSLRKAGQCHRIDLPVPRVLRHRLVLQVTEREGDPSFDEEEDHLQEIALLRHIEEGGVEEDLHLLPEEDLPGVEGLQAATITALLTPTHTIKVGITFTVDPLLSSLVWRTS